MKPCISQATTMPRSFRDDVEAYASAGVAGMEVWLTKLETHLEMESVAATQRLLQDNNMILAAAAYQGGLLLSQGEQRRAHYDHFRRRLGLCQQFGIGTLLVVADFVGNAEPIDLERSAVSLTQAAQWAAGYGIRLAIEFRGRSPFCSSLDTALALLASCGEPNAGVNFDIFHYYTGPSKFEDLDLLTVQNLAHVQLCDLPGIPRELATDGDRILPGDGDFQIQPILQRLRATGYDGWIALEVMNPVFWNMKATQVAEIGLASLNRVLDLAGK